jgi:hypothetical protein
MRASEGKRHLATEPDLLSRSAAYSKRYLHSSATPRHGSVRPETMLVTPTNTSIESFP